MHPFPCSSSPLQATGTAINLDSRGCYPAESNSLVVRQSVHGLLGKVEARGGVVDGQHVDGDTVVGQLEAGTALEGISHVSIV